MIIYTSIDTETKTVTVWTDETSDYYAEWESPEFDTLTIANIVDDVKEEMENA